MQRRSSAEWKELISSQKASGQGVKQWCDKNGINVSSMYNQLVKHRKLETKSGNEQKNAKTKEAEENPARVEWKELKTPTTQQDIISQKGSISIEIGGTRLLADDNYPVMNLAKLCKELVDLC